MLPRRRFRHAMFLALGLHCSPALAASTGFDCGRAEGEVPRLVCQDPRLAELDRELARLFRLAGADQHGSGSDPAALAAGERGWIEGRDACRKTDDVRACVVASYAERIAELRRSYAGARYTGRYGAGTATFWNKGREALLELPGRPAHQCRIGESS